jgi:hypothetical protein
VDIYLDFNKIPHQLLDSLDNKKIFLPKYSFKMRLSVSTPCGLRAAIFSVSEVNPEISANKAAALKFSVVGFWESGVSLQYERPP